MHPLSAVRLVAAFAAWAAVSTIAAPTEAAKVGPVDDPVGVVKIPKGSPIQIGGMYVVSGADAAYGIDGTRAVEIAIEDKGSKVAGHPVKFLVEDDLCNAEGGQTAATKLAANPNIVVVVGMDCSSATTPGAPILWKAGIPSVGATPTAPKLTASDRGPTFDGFLRVVYNDLWQGAGDAKWMYEDLKCKTAATVHDGSPYAQQLVAVFKDNFEKMGGKVVATEAISPTDVDMRPMLTRIATTKPCVVYLPVFVAAGAQIARQAKEMRDLDATQVIVGSNMLTSTFIEATGNTVSGIRLTAPDLSAEAMGKDYPKFLKRHKEKYGENPVQGFHMYSYDAVTLAMKAIEKVAVTDKEGNTYIGRKALRDALFATKNYDGMSGKLNCTANGDCGTFKFAVYEFTNADPKTFNVGTNPKKVFPAK
ncbi:MAG: branched-chain amino acid ABC transporter substrate-binding protein [Alphaproteobacteria bacterium]